MARDEIFAGRLGRMDALREIASRCAECGDVAPAFTAQRFAKTPLQPARDCRGDVEMRELELFATTN